MTPIAAQTLPHSNTDALIHTALEQIDMQAITLRRSVNAQDLIGALESDVKTFLPLMLPVLLKYIPSNSRLTKADLKSIKEILKTGVENTIDHSPKLATSYLRGIELCFNELLIKA